MKANTGRVLTYGQSEGSDVRLVDEKVDFSGIFGRVVNPLGSFEIISKLLGDFSIYNILAAVTVALALEIPPGKIQKGIRDLTRVPGRLDPVSGPENFLVLVDYAHTPGALDNVLESVARLAKGRVITVFGCGGDRDPGKRPLMGDAVAGQSHVTIVTSDNPRTEDPMAIIEDILQGTKAHDLEEIEPEHIGSYQKGKGLVVMPDRRKAIAMAIKGAGEKDIVLIAGKGHEDYQIIGTEKHDFDDRIEAEKILRELSREKIGD